MTVYRAGNTTYLVIDSGALNVRFEGTPSRTAQIRDGDRFAVTFGYELDEHAATGPEITTYTAIAEFMGLDRSEPLPPERINRSVKVNIDPDDAVFARLRLGEDRTVTAPVEPVDWSGFRTTSLDLRAVDSGTDYTLELVHDGSVVDCVTGTVRTPQARLADVTLTEVSTDLVVTRDGQRVTDEITDHTAVTLTATLSHGGKVEVFDERCEEVGHAWIEPGGTRVAIELWDGGDPVRDVDPHEYGVLVRAVRESEFRTEPYPGAAARAAVNWTSADCPLPDAAQAHDSPVTATDPGESRSSTVRMTPRVRSPGTPDPTGVTSTPGQPGFTSLAALVAMLSLGLAGRHRDGWRSPFPTADNRPNP